MNKKRVALALAAALGINTLMVTVGQVGGQAVIAHATQSSTRLSDEQAKLLEGFKISTLDTVVKTTTDGKTELTFNGLKLDEVEKVEVSTNFKHEVFTERKDVDTALTNTIGGDWANGKLTLKDKLTKPGIYTGAVKITYKDKNRGNKGEEIYTISLRKTPSDSMTLTAALVDGTIKITNLKANNGVEDFKTQPTTITLRKEGSTGIEKEYKNGEAVFSLADLVPGGKISKDDKFEVVYKYGTKGTDGNYPYELVSKVVITEDANPRIEKVSATNTEIDNATLKGEVGAYFNKTATDVSIPAASKGTSNYKVTVGNGEVFNFNQTYSTVVAGSDLVLGGAKLTATTDKKSKVNLEIAAPALASEVMANGNFVPDATLAYSSTTANPGKTSDTGLIGEYYLKVGAETHSYFNATTGKTFAAKEGAQNVWLDVTPAALDKNISVTSPKYSFNVDSLTHGYTSVDVVFGVNAANDIQEVDRVNGEITTKAGTTKNAVTADPVATDATVTTSLVVLADTLDAQAVQAKFERTSDSEGTITLSNGKNLIGNTSLSSVKLTVNDGQQVGDPTVNNNDLIFKVQFNTEVPSSITWTLNTNGNLTDTIRDTGIVEDIDLTSVKVENISVPTQFKVTATFNKEDLTKTPITVSPSDSDRVTFEQFKAGTHDVSTEVKSGKYQGKYTAGIWVDVKSVAVAVKASNETSSSVTLTINGTPIAGTDALKNVSKAYVQYRIKGSTTDWNNTTHVKKVDLTGTTLTDIQNGKKDITTVISGLESAKEYEFRVVYEVSENNTLKETVTAETTAKTSTSSSSTITGNGSSSSTTGTSTGSTTINVTTNNSTLTGTSASVTLPTSFRYDSSKTPVAVTFKYKDKDGKVVTETKEQFSNVTAKFNGDKVEVYGLVPGKNYDEITVDYTDNNGRTRSIVLRNIQTSTTVESEKYLANVYEVVLSRPADEAGYHFHLDNLKNKKVSLREFLLNMLSEKEFIEKYKSTEEKIEGLYNAIVARSSDEAGKKFWVDEYKKVLAVYGSETTALKAIADRMVNENELKELADKMGVQW